MGIKVGTKLRTTKHGALTLRFKFEKGDIVSIFRMKGENITFLHEKSGIMCCSGISRIHGYTKKGIQFFEVIPSKINPNFIKYVEKESKI